MTSTPDRHSTRSVARKSESLADTPVSLTHTAELQHDRRRRLQLRTQPRVHVRHAHAVGARAVHRQQRVAAANVPANGARVPSMAVYENSVSAGYK